MNPTVPSTGYIAHKLAQAEAKYPNQPRNHLINFVWRKAQEDLAQWIFYLTPDEWRSTGLHFSGLTPDASAFTLRELNKMAETIQIYLPASIERLENRYKTASQLRNILNTDTAVLHPSWQEIVSFFKTQCQENGWPWPPPQRIPSSSD